MTDSYILLGHGVENPINFEQRKRLPEGVTLVTLAECGELTYDEEVCSIVEAFTKPENKDMFTNPALNRAKLRALVGNIHIYTSNQSYPSLKIQMFLDWPSETNTKIMKSGTYRFPLDPRLFQSGEGATFCERLFQNLPPYQGHFTQKLSVDYKAELMFQDSLKPSLDEVKAINTVNVESMKKAVTVDLEDCFMGPGVYYFVVCREIKLLTSPENFIKGMREASWYEDAERYTPYFSKNWLKHIPELIELLNADIANPHYIHVRPSIVRLRNSYIKIPQQISLIRQKSNKQQSLVRKRKRKGTRRK